MGFWGKVKKTAKKTFKKANAPVLAVSKRLEKAARPISRPVRDAVKKRVKGTPLEATVRAATDWDIRKPHVSGLKAGHAVGSMAAAYWTGGASLAVTGIIDKKIYGNNVGSFTFDDFKNAKNWVSSASKMAEDFQDGGGLEGLKQKALRAAAEVKSGGAGELAALREEVVRGDFRSAEKRMNKLRQTGDNLYGQATGAISDAKHTLNTGPLRRVTNATPPASEAARLGNRLAGGAGNPPVAASVLAALRIPCDASAAAVNAPRGHNQLALAALAVVGIYLIIK